MNSDLLESRKAKNYNSTSLKYSYQYFTTMTVLSDDTKKFLLFTSNKFE